jgi:putative hydrolase of the HAD superfamily
MTGFVMRHLGIEREPADRLRADYWRRYGATMLGLIRHHAVDPHAFLHETHDFDILALLRAEPGLSARLRALPGRKVLLTNAPAAYAATVTAGLSIRQHLARRYAIESMRIHGRFRPKPARNMLRVMLARERCAPGRAVLVDDNLGNLRAARAVGLRTIWMKRTGEAGKRPPHVDFRLRTVRGLRRLVTRLARGRGGAAPNQ